MNDVAVQAAHLSKSYGAKRVLHDLSFGVSPGDVIGVLGKNGAGKTTSFNMIVGLVRPTSGEIYLNGENIAQMPMYRRARRGIGYLPQEESIFRKLSVEDNLMAILETLHMTNEGRKQKLEALLNEFGLQHVRKSKAYMLSGGEKRRLSIARCLSTDPAIVLLDEPFSGVDPLAVSSIQDIIISIRNRGVAVLITDHNVRETLSVVDRAYLICDGKVESEGTSEFLINDPVAREIYLGERFTM